MDKAEAQRAHFNKISNQYIQGRSHSNHLAYKKIWWNFILSHLSRLLPKSKKLYGLDSMCGDGEFSFALAKKFKNLNLDAYDYSEEMVRAGVKKIGQLKAKINIFQADALKFNKKDKYDFVVILGGLHHVPYGLNKVMKNVYYSLKKGGLFINLEPTHNNFLWKTSRENIYKKNPLFESESEKAFDFKEYNDLLIKNKFEITEQIWPGLLGYILYYNPDAFPNLNIGTPSIARFLAKLDLFLGKTFIGKYLSFATWTIAMKK